MILGATLNKMWIKLNIFHQQRRKIEFYGCGALCRNDVYVGWSSLCRNDVYVECGALCGVYLCRALYDKCYYVVIFFMSATLCQKAYVSKGVLCRVH